MGTNLGIPCRHYFQALTVVKAKGLQFHVGLVHARWYQDPDLDLTKISTVPLDYVGDPRALPKLTTVLLGPLLSNPLSPSKQSKGSVEKTFTSATQTVAARTVFHEAQAAIRPLLSGVQTQEQLDTLVDSLSSQRECLQQKPPRNFSRSSHFQPQGTSTHAAANGCTGGPRARRRWPETSVVSERGWEPAHCETQSPKQVQRLPPGGA